MKNIDFRNGQPLVMMVSQYDYGYDLQVALWSNGEPVTITAAEIVSENFTVTCTFSGNVVTIPIGTSMTEQFGHFPAELRVTDSLGQVSSKNFDFFVERSPLAVKSTQTYSGDIVEFTAKSVPLNSVVVTMEPIQSGSGDPSPTNVRPITGRTGASVVVAGKNLFVDKGQGYWRVSDGAFITSGTTVQTYRSCEKIPVIAGAQYTGFVKSTYDQPTNVYVQWWKADGTGREVKITQWPIVAPEDAVLMSYAFRFASTTIAREAVNVIQVEQSDTATEYEANTTTTYPITFTSAGTVYAGTVDLVSGVLTVTHELATYDGTTGTFTQNGSDIIALNVGQTRWQNVGSGYVPLSNQFKGIAPGASTGLSAGEMRYTLNFVNMNFRFGSDKTVAQWKTELAQQPLQVLHLLATPLTYNLTPTQVMSLLGENIVWSPDGEIEVVVPEYY